jgi:hypothetical protein
VTPPGHIRSDGRGGLRVVIEEVEHWVPDLYALLCTTTGGVGYFFDPNPAPLLRGDHPECTGHMVSSRTDSDETPTPDDLRLPGQDFRSPAGRGRRGPGGPARGEVTGAAD